MTRPASAPSLVCDSARLDALRGYAVLDTPADPAFDRIVDEAAAACRTPIALVSLVDDHRQWFKAKVGMAKRETDLTRSICAKAIDYPGEVFVVRDAEADPRVNSNPLVYGDPNIRFYAGAPLVTPDGHTLGMLCVIDTERRPNGLRTDEHDALTALAAKVMALMAAHRARSKR